MPLRNMRSAIMITILLHLMAVPAVAAGETVPARRIDVFGSAEVKARADQATLRCSVLGYGSTLQQAVERARQKIGEIVKKLIAVGLTTDNISTSRFYPGPNKGKKAFLSSKKDFQTAIALTITIDQLDLLEQTLYTLSDLDLETLSPVRFSVKDDFALRSQAREKAIGRAREKAIALAGELGATLGRICIVEEMSANPSSINIRPGRSNPFNYSGWDAEYGSAGSGIAALVPEITSRTAQVRLVFELAE